MSGSVRSLLCLVQRGVAVRQLTAATASTASAARNTALSGRSGFIRQRTSTPATRTMCQQRLGELRSSVRSSRYSFCTKTQEPCDGEYPPLPDCQLDTEPEKKEVFIVQVKGFSWSCSAQDLLHFFSECRIRDGVKGIHLTTDRRGRPSGQAFIEMEHEEDVSKALEKHWQYLGPRYVEVYEVTNSDAEAILKKALQAPAQDGVVRLRGLPFTCTEADIVHFFSGLDIVENGITFVTDHRGRKSGEAFVQFSSQEAADEAQQRDREVIGNRYIEVFPSRRDKIHSSWMQRMSPASSHTGLQSSNRTVPASQTNPKTGSPQIFALPPHYIYMRGLPFQASGEDIVKFFSPLVVSKILIECGPDGSPNGEAAVFFSCHQDTMDAMSRDRQHIGERYIELFLNSVQDSD